MASHIPNKSNEESSLAPEMKKFKKTTGVEYALAIDVEITGERTDSNSMVAIGGCVVRVSDSAVMSSFLRFMKMEEGHGFSPTCKEEYWDNWIKFPMNKVVLQRIREEGLSPQHGIRDFAEWLDRQEREYESRGEKLVVVMDTVGSDAMWVSHYFQKYLNRGPIKNQFGDDKLYRSIKHGNAYAQGLAGSDQSSEFNWRQALLDKGVALPSDKMHNHMPDSDAQHIATTYAACVRWAHNQIKE